jgi:Flp pilus assembly protein TadD
MRKWVVGLACAVWLFCAPLRAQNRAACVDDGPPPITVQAGPLGPDYGDRIVRCSPSTGHAAANGLVSARTLAHKPLKAATREFDRGVQASRKGQNEEAVRHLAEALRWDPIFVEAQTELGSIYAKTGQPEQALNWFNRAVALDPNWAVLHSNRAAALVILKRPEEAEQAARRALQLDVTSIQAHYMLGISLLMQEKITPEAIAHLAFAADQYPNARLFLDKARAALDARQVR